LQVPLAPHLLQRRRRTAPQASLPATRRVANVRGAFRARAHRDLAGARLLLVDDIMTTGATVNEAAKMLVKAGAAFVAIAVVARSEGLS
jgi:predicted amidophosphoribosyltransferase